MLNLGMSDIELVAKELVQKGKGIFAADASQDTLDKRMKEAGIETVGIDVRKKYREIIFSTPNLSDYIAGIIMHDEAVPDFTQIIIKSGIIPGVKVDGGLVDSPDFPGEKTTLGLDGLDERLKNYAALGIGFVKWRAVIIKSIGDNAKILAEYAKKSQEAGLVPIVEPEVLGENSHEVTKLVGQAVFKALVENNVNLAGIIYKPNMIIPDAKRTVETMKEIVPEQVPGIAFLSGGQDAKQATLLLNEIAKAGVGAKWNWTFSFERAIEGPAMQAWGGKQENIAKTQQVLLHRAKMNSKASIGLYNQEEDL